jgi:N-acetylmuramoyl-L-alanine amidase
MSSGQTIGLILILLAITEMKHNLQIYFQKACSNSLSHQRRLVLIVALLVSTAFQFPAMAQRGSKITTVVIDPGHGGRDPGAVGRRAKEKDIVLSIALKTGSYIEQYLPDVKVIYTRTTDEFVELHRRASIANKSNADIFISIHCNATRSATVHGAETFVMGEHRSQANLEVAKLENAAILLEDDAEEAYGGFDPNSPEAYIAFTLYQSEYKNQSIRLAQKVQEQFTTRVGRRDRSVQQAGFWVLYRTTMPSILVELGFLTNPAEEEFLMSEQGQVYMASALFRAFRDYKVEFEKENNIPQKVAGPKAESAKVSADELVASAAAVTGTQKQSEAIEPKKENVSAPLTNQTTSPAQPATATPSAGLVYKVQFATNPHNVSISDSRFSDILHIGVYFHNGLYKYTSGKFSNLDDAIRHQAVMRNQGHKDAFVVAFNNGERISVDEARRIENP